MNTRLVFEGGRPTRASVIVHDISARKQAEQALRDSEERLKILFEYAPDAIYMFDLNGLLLDMNRAAEGLTGYSRGELIGKHLRETEILLQADVERLAESWTRNANDEATGPEEYVLNAGIGGALEAFDRVDFRSLFTQDRAAELALLLEGVGAAPQGETLESTFPGARQISGPDEWDPAADHVIAEVSTAVPLISKAIL